MAKNCRDRLSIAKEHEARTADLESMIVMLATNTGRYPNTNIVRQVPALYVHACRTKELNPCLLVTAAVAPEYYRESANPLQDEYRRAFSLGLNLVRPLTRIA